MFVAILILGAVIFLLPYVIKFSIDAAKMIVVATLRLFGFTSSYSEEEYEVLETRKATSAKSPVATTTPQKALAKALSNATERTTTTTTPVRTTSVPSPATVFARSA
jgi:hypothetical protein